MVYVADASILAVTRLSEVLSQVCSEGPVADEDVGPEDSPCQEHVIDVADVLRKVLLARRLLAVDIEVTGPVDHNLLGRPVVGEVGVDPVLRRAVPANIEAVNLDVVQVGVVVFVFRHPLPRVAGDHPREVVAFEIPVEGVVEVREALVEDELVAVKPSRRGIPVSENVRHVMNGLYWERTVYS